MCEFQTGFRLAARLSLMVGDWSDWTPQGLNDLAAMVRSAIALRLFAIDTCRHLPGFPVRHGPEFIAWALNWLSAEQKTS